MEIPQLPDDIIKMIMNINRQERDKELAEFWEEWSEEYEDELYDWYEDDYIHHTIWEELSINDKIKIYKHHKRLVSFHESVLCDGAPPDWYWGPLPNVDKNYDRETGEYIEKKS